MHKQWIPGHFFLLPRGPGYKATPRLQVRELELAVVVGALVGAGLCIPLSYAGVIGQVPGAKALASVEEFKESLKEGLQQEKLATPLTEKISAAYPALPDPILSLFAPETSTCYQFVQSVLKICFALAKSMG